MKDFIATKLLDNKFKQLFYLHLAVPFAVVIVFESLVGRRVGIGTYAIALLYMSYSVFRLWKSRSNAATPKQKNTLLMTSTLLLFVILLQLLSFK